MSYFGCKECNSNWMKTDHFKDVGVVVKVVFEKSGRVYSSYTGNLKSGNRRMDTLLLTSKPSRCSFRPYFADMTASGFMI